MAVPYGRMPTKWNPNNIPEKVEVLNDLDTSTASYALKLDEASSTVTYIGEATPGSSGAAAVWRIKKMDTTSGVVITWADGDSLFDNVWNNRAALSYS